MQLKNVRFSDAGIAFPVLLFLSGVAAFGTTAYFQHQTIEKSARAEFERMSIRADAQIADRLEKVLTGLRGASGLFAANQHIDRGAFRRYVLARDMEKEFAGVRGFGFIQRVERADLASFVAAERADGAPEFSVHQLNDTTQQDLFISKFIEPAINNEGAQALDIGSEALRRAGLRQAINTGAATVTGVISLVQDDKKRPAVLLYQPVYRAGAPMENYTQRNAALVGVLYAPIVMEELLQGMPDVQLGLLDFAIVDAPINSSGGGLMFDADNHLKQLPAGSDPGVAQRYSLSKPLQLPGRSVTLSMRSTPAFDATINQTQPWLILGGGSLISALLALILHQQATGRRRAEHLARIKTNDLNIALRDNRTILTVLNLHSIVSVTDLGGYILEANDAFCQISGYSRTELLGSNHSIVNSSMQSKEFWEDMWITISSGKPWRAEVCNMSKSGQPYWVDTLVTAFVGDDGKIEKYVSIRTDISARKKAEEELRWSQSLMEKMSNSSPLALLVVDNRSDDILYFNERFCQLWGIDHLAAQMHSRALKNKDTMSACTNVLADATAYAESCKPLQDVRNRVTLEDEIAFTGQRTVRRYTTQIRDSDDHYFGRFYIFEDITERKTAEHALTKAIDEAQAASLAKSQFLANMSHEIRTPMHAILGMLMLLGKTDLSARQADYAAKSEGAARTLLSLLNEILDFSKIEAGKMELDPHPFAVDKLLLDLSVILSTSVGIKPIEVLFDIDPKLPRQLMGDAMRIQQVLLNLGSNAIKFTERGEVVLSIQVLRQSEEAVTLQFCMRDSGIGIAAENFARIFSGFTQAEASTTRRFGGTGLGVAISQRFVALMGGELELQSELGKGSRFYFTLTLPVLAAVVEDKSLLEVSLIDSQFRRVLVIDDNPIAREVMEHMCGSLGWTVDLAAGGQSGLELLQQRSAEGVQYQAIFVDWNMPDMDGWQTSQHIREILLHRKLVDGHKQVPVVVMVTAHGREMMTQRTAEDQLLIDSVVIKPVTASMLLNAVIDARDHNDNRHPSVINGPKSLRRLDGMRLLLVEDNVNNQQVARELLEDEGALMEVAHNGVEALEAIAKATPGNAYDVVLMDLQMPVMDGFTATEKIRKELGLTTLPVIAMTANAMSSDRDACIAAGMNDHVGKPFDLNELVRVLRHHAKWESMDSASTQSEPLVNPAIQKIASDTGVDLVTALHRLGGKQDVYMRMLRSFVNDLKDMQDQLLAFPSEASQPSKLDDTKRLLHTLKGLAATLGATALSNEAASGGRALSESLTTERHLLAVSRVGDATTYALHGLKALLAELQQVHSATEHDNPLCNVDSIDKPMLQAALRALSSSLEQQDMESMTAMAELQKRFGQSLGEGIADLEVAMADMDFEKALPFCNALLEKYS